MTHLREALSRPWPGIIGQAGARLSAIEFGPRGAAVLVLGDNPGSFASLQSSRFRKGFLENPHRTVLYVEVTNRLSVFRKVIGGILVVAGTPGWYRLSPHSSLSQSK